MVMTERLLVRILVAFALCIALLAMVVVPVPVDAKGDPDLPAPALGQRSLYRLEVGLMVFYGDLLLVTPAFSGLARGRLPIEISTRGAKFAEDADRSAERNEKSIKELKLTVDLMRDRLTKARLEIDRLKRR